MTPEERTKRLLLALIESPLTNEIQKADLDAFGNQIAAEIRAAVEESEESKIIETDYWSRAFDRGVIAGKAKAYEEMRKFLDEKLANNNK